MEFSEFSTNTMFSITNQKLLFLSHRKHTRKSDGINSYLHLFAFFMETDEYDDNRKAYKSVGH